MLAFYFYLFNVGSFSDILLMSYGTREVIFFSKLTQLDCRVFRHVLSELGTDYQTFHRQPTPPLNNRWPTTDVRRPTHDNRQPVTANDNNDRQSTKRLPPSDPTHSKEQPTVKKCQQQWTTINNQNPTSDNNNRLTDSLTAIILNSALPILYYLIFIQHLLSYDCCNFYSFSSQIEPHNEKANNFFL